MGRTGEKWKGRDRSGKDGREVGEDRRDVGEDLGWGGGSWRKALPAPSPVIPGLWNPREQARSVLLNNNHSNPLKLNVLLSNETP